MKDKYTSKKPQPVSTAAATPAKGKFTPELSRSNLTKKIGSKSAHDEIVEARKVKLDQKL